MRTPAQEQYEIDVEVRLTQNRLRLARSGELLDRSDDRLRDSHFYRLRQKVERGAERITGVQERRRWLSGQQHACRIE